MLRDNDPVVTKMKILKTVGRILQQQDEIEYTSGEIDFRQLVIVHRYKWEGITYRGTGVESWREVVVNVSENYFLVAFICLVKQEARSHQLKRTEEEVLKIPGERV